MPNVEEGQFSTEGSVHLDALRGLAAIVVVLGHTRSLYFTSVANPAALPPPASTAATTTAGTSADLPNPPATIAPPTGHIPAESRITIGNEAVMIFFVLSGFLVGGSVLRAFHKRNWSWRDYLIKRLTRLWVVLIPALLLGLCMDRVGLRLFGADSIYASPPGQLIVQGSVVDRLALPVFLGNLFFTQGILVPLFGVNESLWSLAYEFWYYILFPLLGILLLSRSRPLSRVLALAAFLAIAWFVGRHILSLFPVWMLGAAVAWLPLRLSRAAAGRLALAIAAVLLLAMPLMRRAPIPMYLAQWVIALLSGGLIYGIKHLDMKRRPDIYSAASGFFSRISYTLYLVHLPLAVFFCALMNHPWRIWAKTPANLAIWLAMNLVLIAITFVLYRLFEARTDTVRRTITRSTQRARIAA